MKKIIGILIIAVSFASCKPKQAAISEQPVVTGEAAKSAGEVIAGHNSIPKDFKTLYINHKRTLRYLYYKVII